MSASESAIPFIRPAPPPPLLGRLWERFGWNVLVALEVVAALALWELLAVGFHALDADYFPPPSKIGASLEHATSIGYLGKNFVFSAQNFVVGYLLAAAAGITLGLVMGTSALLSTALSPFVWTMYSTPRIVLAPLIVIWFGFGWESKVFVIFLTAVFPILLNVLAGVRAVDASLVRAGRVFGASRLTLLTKVILPFTVPYTLVGLRQGIARGLVGVVVGELIGSSAGLGYMIQRAANTFDLATALGVTFLLVAMANVSMLLLDAVTRRVAPWHQEGAA